MRGNSRWACRLLGRRRLTSMSGTTIGWRVAPSYCMQAIHCRYPSRAPALWCHGAAFGSAAHRPNFVVAHILSLPPFFFLRRRRRSEVLLPLLAKGPPCRRAAAPPRTRYGASTCTASRQQRRAEGLRPCWPFTAACRRPAARLPEVRHATYSQSGPQGSDGAAQPEHQVSRHVCVRIGVLDCSPSP